MLFEPFKLKTIELKNRILRSSMGGKTCYYGGAVSPAWQKFDTRFAERGVAAIISATVSVDDRRWAPLQYPKISDDRFIGPIQAGVRAVQALDCRYIMQIGDGGYHAQMSLFAKPEDSKTASAMFDFVFGYTNKPAGPPRFAVSLLPWFLPAWPICIRNLPVLVNLRIWLSSLALPLSQTLSLSSTKIPCCEVGHS